MLETLAGMSLLTVVSLFIALLAEAAPTGRFILNSSNDLVVKRAEGDVLPFELNYGNSANLRADGISGKARKEKDSWEFRDEASCRVMLKPAETNAWLVKLENCGPYLEEGIYRKDAGKPVKRAKVKRP